jgi:uncharacterized membrane protein
MSVPSPPAAVLPMKISKFPVIVWVVCLIVFIASVVLSQADLPDRVADHFNSAGTANGWTSRSAFTAFFVVFGTIFSSFVIGICYSIRFFPSRLLNVPNPEYWRSPKHYPEACAFLFGHAFWFGALAAIWFGLFHYLVVRANLLAPAVLDSKTLTILTVAFLGGTFLWAISLIRHFRNVPAGGA